MKSVIRLIFFGNYFIASVAVILSIESNVQLKLPLNSLLYYVILFLGTMVYYTYAYAGPLTSKSHNARAEWYRKHHFFIVWSQRICVAAITLLSAFFTLKNLPAILHINKIYWLFFSVTMLAAVLYYGLLPRSSFKINLRQTGWLKAFVIGFVWACCVNVLSFIALQIERGNLTVNPQFMFWLFVKNWMFCTVNAIMFDIKDYAHDSNLQLKTFVVRFGLRKTIFFVLLPLLLVGLLSLIAFTTSKNFGYITTLINVIPFLLLLIIAWSMQRPHKIMYYLVVIDGSIFIKALCGIIGMQFIK